jgi:hypothetical protein
MNARKLDQVYSLLSPREQGSIIHAKEHSGITDLNGLYSWIIDGLSEENKNPGFFRSDAGREWIAHKLRRRQLSKYEFSMVARFMALTFLEIAES